MLLAPRPSVDDFGYTQVPTARTLLALFRSAGAADRGGARRARSGPAGGAVRRQPASVLDHARVPAARSAGFSAGARHRARVGGVSRDRRRRDVSSPRALLVD